MGLFTLLVCFVVFAWLFRSLANTPYSGSLFKGGGGLFKGIFRLGFPMTLREMLGMNRLGGSRFLKPSEQRELFHPRNDGLLIDGQKARLDQQTSFTHVAIISPTGGGKTTRYVIPNLLTLERCSMVVTDPSGELFARTSGYLEAKGYRVRVVNPTDPRMSLGYNPLAKVSNPLESGEVAHILLESSLSKEGGKDAFWNQGAETLIDILIQCLKRSREPGFATLSNVLYCLQNFGERGAGLDSFIEQYASESVYNQYVGLIQAPEKTLGSWVATATTALRMLNIPEMAYVTGFDDIRFSELRETPTVLYVIVPSEKISFYAFFLNLFYT